MIARNTRLFLAMLLLLLIHSSDSIAQRYRTFNDLRFHSAYEKSIFENILNRNLIDTVGLFMAIDDNITSNDVARVRKKFFDQSDIFYSTYNKSKPQSKFIKDLFNFVHKSYLKKYDLDVNFNAIEQNGTYNCVTASALYALFFSRYNISYSIKEAPTHVYLIANPGTSNIMIETTSPTAGYFMPDDRFRKSYLDYLLENKAITREEISAEGERKAFEKNYYKQDQISIIELAALQYYNHGVSFFDKSDYRHAYSAFVKAYFLYPSSKIKMMINAAAAEIVTGSPLTDTADVNVYVSSFSYSNSVKENDLFVQNFEIFTQRNLVEKNNFNYYETIYHRIMNSINDSLLKDRITFVYYSQKGRVAALIGNFDESIVFLAKALKLNREQKEMAGLLSAALIEKYVNTEKCGDVMLSFTRENDFLLSNKRYNEAICYCYLKETGNYFASTNYRKAFEALRIFEEFQSKYQVSPNAENVGFVYGNASSYYIRKGDYKQGRKYLLNGLKISPTSIELNRKLSVLDNN